jgi:hypothetical protein
MIRQPNPYYWQDSQGWWPYPWDNWPTKTPWDHRRGASAGRNRTPYQGTAQWENPEWTGEYAISSNVDQKYSLAPQPDFEFDDLSFLPSSAEEFSLSFLPGFMSKVEGSPTAAAEEIDTGWDADFFEEEQPWGNLNEDAISLPNAEKWSRIHEDPSSIIDAGIWGTIEGDPFATVDSAALTIPEQDPLFFVHDAEAMVTS